MRIVLPAPPGVVSKSSSDGMPSVPVWTVPSMSSLLISRWVAAPTLSGTGVSQSRTRWAAVYAVPDGDTEGAQGDPGVVDPLVGVAGDEQVVGTFRDQRAQQPPLRRVQVLCLVDDDVAVRRSRTGFVPQQPGRLGAVGREQHDPQSVVDAYGAHPGVAGADHRLQVQPLVRVQRSPTLVGDDPR